MYYIYPNLSMSRLYKHISIDTITYFVVLYNNQTPNPVGIIYLIICVFLYV
jgi:hypothetical protein